MAFLADLHRRFRRPPPPPCRRIAPSGDCASTRGEGFDFLPHTAAIRSGDWRVRPAPADLLDRRVEITGPVDRKMIINALNSGAKVFMADFEDATAPRFATLIDGQANLMDRWRNRLTHADPRTGKTYALGPNPAVLFVRARAVGIWRSGMCGSAGEAMSGALFDFGLYVFHNAALALAQGSGAYVYLPKLESHLEARLWSEVFAFTEDRLGLGRGTIRATVLIETLPAAFEMDEILHELRDHIVGLNCGRWGLYL